MNNNYDPQAVFGEKLEQYEEILHSGIVRYKAGCLFGGCITLSFLPIPLMIFIVSLLTKEYIMAAEVGIGIIAFYIVFRVLKYEYDDPAPTIITSKRLLSKIGDKFQSVYYDDIQEISFNRRNGAITVVAVIAQLLVVGDKATKNKENKDS
ncbi:MAG: hypothetical protein IKK47_08450, partial [Ruminococcus sp.]|nr:hypothetical protein [Ruminococcus sp.]